jgi:hypothetical protein
MSSCCEERVEPDSQGKVRDLTDRKWPQAIWAANYVALAAGWLFPTVRPVLWSVGLAAAGVLCVANAARCRRLHCHISGPVYLLGSALSILNAIGIIRISWNFLGIAVLLGVAISYLPELLVGKYIGRSQPSAGEKA